ncbi:MAG: hypothetical protein IJ572_05395 [Bacilli bacterium]|nr:hypothetical protein [Bacilli bacterium]
MIKIPTDEISRLHREDFIWLIYFFIIGYNLYSNYLEETYIKTKDKYIRKKYKRINKKVLIVVFIIYLYFLIVSYDKCKELNNNLNTKRIINTYLSLLVSILFIIAGAISIYIAFSSELIDDEIGIN